MFMTSISKLSSSIHLSWAFQLNEDFPGVSPPHLCLCISLRLAVEADQGPTSASLSAIISAVAAYTATWLTIA